MPQSVWEVSGTIPDLFRPILDNVRPILDQNRLKTYIRKIPIKNPYTKLKNIELHLDKILSQIPYFSC